MVVVYHNSSKLFFHNTIHQQFYLTLSIENGGDGDVFYKADGGALSTQSICVHMCTATCRVLPLRTWLLGRAVLCLHKVLALAGLCQCGLASSSQQPRVFDAASSERTVTLCLYYTRYEVVRDSDQD